MRKSKAKNLHAGKTLGQAGVTPRLTAFSRPKFCGVTPACHAGSVTMFCPRAYRDVFNRVCGEETISTEERREFRWQY
jgi:hypothetical protein